jgi:hypothetical protein
MRSSFPSWAGRLCVAVLLASSLGQEAPARTRIVDCAGGSDHEHCGWSEAPCGTIQRALDRSSNGDRVEVKRGVCKGPGNIDLRFRGLEVELVGREWTPDSGPAVEISCGGAGRAFKFEHNEGTRTKISGFLVRDCQAGYGGAVWCENASPLFERVVFSDNKAGYAGGGVYWVTRGPVLRDVEFVRNSAGSYGPDTASTFTTLDLPGFPLADYTPGAPFPGHGVQARLLDPYGQIVSTTYDIKMAIRLIFSDEAGGTGGRTGGGGGTQIKNEERRHCPGSATGGGQGSVPWATNGAAQKPLSKLVACLERCHRIHRRSLNHHRHAPPPSPGGQCGSPSRRWSSALVGHKDVCQARHADNHGGESGGGGGGILPASLCPQMPSGRRGVGA